MIIVDTFSGSHQEIGVAKGETYRHLINNFIQEGVVTHAPHKNDHDLNVYIENNVELLKKYCPQLLDEITGIAAGSGLPFKEVVLLSIYWAQYRQDISPELGCFSIGVIDPYGNPIVGSNWDVARIIGVFNRIKANNGYHHFSISVVGTPFSERGMNEKGLVMVNSSLGQKFTLEDPPLCHNLLMRILLEKCSTVREALEIITEFPTSCSYILADATGDLAGIQLTRYGHVIHRPDNGPITYANCPNDQELIDKLEEQGISFKKDPEHNDLRLEAANKLIKKADEKFDLPFVKGFLASHQNHPHSICNNGNANAFIAQPGTDTSSVLMSERFPCRNPFEKYPIG